MSKNKFHLHDLVGKHVLTGVDREIKKINKGYEDCEVIRFCLDGLTYVATEDPIDGYRSMLEDIFIDPNPNHRIKNTFKPVKVIGKMKPNTRHETNDVIEFWRNDKLILAVGTSNTSDYYPSFVADFHPENIG